VHEQGAGGITSEAAPCRSLFRASSAEGAMLETGG